MITIVVACYAVLMLTIVLALFAAARRPQPKMSTVSLEEMPVRRSAKPVFQPTVSGTVNGGSEVLAFEE